MLTYIQGLQPGHRWHYRELWVWRFGLNWGGERERIMLQCWGQCRAQAEAGPWATAYRFGQPPQLHSVPSYSPSEAHGVQKIVSLQPWTWSQKSETTYSFIESLCFSQLYFGVGRDIPTLHHSSCVLIMPAWPNCPHAFRLKSNAYFFTKWSSSSFIEFLGHFIHFKKCITF